MPAFCKQHLLRCSHPHLTTHCYNCAAACMYVRMQKKAAGHTRMHTVDRTLPLSLKPESNHGQHARQRTLSLLVAVFADPTCWQGALTTTQAGGKASSWPSELHTCNLLAEKLSASRPEVLLRLESAPEVYRIWVSSG